MDMILSPRSALDQTEAGMMETNTMQTQTADPDPVVVIATLATQLIETQDKLVVAILNPMKVMKMYVEETIPPIGKQMVLHL